MALMKTLNGYEVCDASARSSLNNKLDKTATATNSDKLDGYHGSSSASANTYVLRDGNNHIYANYISSNTSNNENPSISQVIVTKGSDNYYRKASLAHLTNQIISTGSAAPTSSTAGKIYIQTT